jgi:hypothetical protein
MSLKFLSKREYGREANGRTDQVIRQLPQGVQSMRTAPQASATPIQVFDSDGKASWALFHREQWNKLAPEKDSHTGKIQWRMNGDVISQPIAWLPRQR